MAITYSDNYSFPLLDSGSDGWDATMNGFIEDVDRMMWQRANPLVSMDSEAVMVSYIRKGIILRYQDVQ